MVAVDDQHLLRSWVDRLLSVTNQGLQGKVLGRLKNHLSGTYSADMQAFFEPRGVKLPPGASWSDTVILKHMDLLCTLTMMKKWKEAFEDVILPRDSEHVQRLIDLRNRFAHPTTANAIRPDEACDAAESAVFLLERLRANGYLKEVGEIGATLRAIADGKQNVPLPPQRGQAESVLESSEAAADYSADSQTERLIPIREDRLYIEVIYRSGQTDYVPVPTDVERVVIGRSRNSSIVIHDQRVSRVHLLVVPNTTGLLIADLHSANGTLLNGVRVQPNQPVHWSVGERVIIGSTWLVLRRA